MAAVPASLLTWSPSLDRRALAAAGHQVVEFSWLCGEIATWSRSAAGPRDSLANPAQAWLSCVARSDKLAVLDVQLRELGELVALHGYVLEPALRCGTALAIESRQRLTRLAPEDFLDPGFEYAYTLERAIEVATRLYRGSAQTRADRTVPPAAHALDAEQLRAAQAHDGVVQVIAPA